MSVDPGIELGLTVRVSVGVSVRVRVRVMGGGTSYDFTLRFQ